MTNCIFIVRFHCLQSHQVRREARNCFTEENPKIYDSTDTEQSLLFHHYLVSRYLYMEPGEVREENGW